MWRRTVMKIAVLVLAGCERPWIYNPLSFECIATPIMVHAPQWSEHDVEVFEKRMEYYSIPLSSQLDMASFEIVLDPIDHQSFDHYVDTVAKSFYRNYHSSVHVVATRLQTKEVILDKTFHAVQTLKDNPHVYQDSQIAQANVLWAQQIILFDKIALELKTLCELTLSGTV